METLQRAQILDAHGLWAAASSRRPSFVPHGDPGVKCRPSQTPPEATHEGSGPSRRRSSWRLQRDEGLRHAPWAPAAPCSSKCRFENAHGGWPPSSQWLASFLFSRPSSSPSATPDCASRSGQVVLIPLCR